MQEPTLSELYRTLKAHVVDSSRDRGDFKSMLEKQAEKLDKIEIQTTKTNGRVLALEDKTKKLQEVLDETIKENSNEMKTVDRRMWLAIGGGTVVMVIGALFIKLYIQDISRNTAKDVLAEIQKSYQVDVN